MIVRWDGRVLEVFGRTRTGSVRFHPKLLRSVEIDGSNLTVTTGASDVAFWRFEEAQRADVERLVEAVAAAV